MRLTLPMHQILHLLAQEQEFRSPTEIGNKLDHMCSVRSAGSWAQPWCRRLEDLWLVERSKHGKYRITATGHALVSAKDSSIMHSTESNLRDAMQNVLEHCRSTADTSDDIRKRAYAFDMLNRLVYRDVASSDKTPQWDPFDRTPVLGVDGN